MLKQIADSYRKIRNTMKFILGNLSDYDHSKHAVKYEELPDIDKWILHKLYTLQKDCIASYENYEFHMVYRRIINFCAVELSSIFFDMSKDILYTEAKNSKKRRADQTVLHEIEQSLVRLIAPILAFTSEEVWKFTGNTDSIHEQEYYKLDEAYNNDAIAQKLETLVEIKKDILKALEIKRKDKEIGTSIEAAVSLYVADEKVKAQLTSSPEEIRRFFQVSKVTVLDKKEPGLTDYDKSSVKVEKASGEKCARCWNYFDNLGSNPEYPDLCDRCAHAVIENSK
jgi:isoleucyl-tRNA synthetase